MQALWCPFQMLMVMVMLLVMVMVMLMLMLIVMSLVMVVAAAAWSGEATKYPPKASAQGSASGACVQLGSLGWYL